MNLHNSPSEINACCPNGITRSHRRCEVVFGRLLSADADEDVWKSAPFPSSRRTASASPDPSQILSCGTSRPYREVSPGSAPRTEAWSAVAARLSDRPYATAAADGEKGPAAL